MRKSKEQKAITLIALIITIVVLLILAVVAITSIQNDGIISKAEQATNKYNESVTNEQGILQGYLNYFDPNNGGSTGGTGNEGSGNEGNGNGSGTIGDATVGTKVTSISTINGQAYNENNPVIPAGFKAIETPTTKWDETKLAEEVKKGLVISDDANNQFVWIPVSNINNMVMCQTHNSATINQETLQCPECGVNTKLAGKLYATSTGESFNSTLSTQTYGLNTGSREPDVVTSASGSDSTTGSKYDAVTGNLSIVLEGKYAETEKPTAATFKSQLEDEFTKMAQSVAKYKGFYVGRYETSLSGTTAQSTSGVNSMQGIDWYNMYKNSKTYSRNNTELGVVSEMIWGCQYDQVMQLILTNTEDKDHVKETDNVSHNLTLPYKTGGTNYIGTVAYADIASNIYDLEGNVYEWTQEACNKGRRVGRGGNHNFSGSPSYRNLDYPTESYGSNGSRLSLYVGL